MKYYIISLLLIIFVSVLYRNERFSCLYYNKPDCILNSTCQLPPNNINFFDTNENFVDVYNSPGLNKGQYYPNCPQGFYPSKKKCVQICRNCKTGVCHDGDCYAV